MNRTFKKSFTSLVAVATLIGCGGSTSSHSNASEDFNYVYEHDPLTFDYVVSSRSEDSQFTVNFVDGLVENDSYGRYVGAVAEKIEHSKDYKTWTFKLRDGVNWYTHEKEEYAPVVAQDFVTGLQHALDAKSGAAYLIEGLVKGVLEYEDGKVGFDQVGVKALDDKTVEYTLESPATYFDSLASYTILYPINQKFLESKGAGCKLGAYDPNSCSFGAATADSILYNGAYFLENFTTKSKIVYTKNENYWDKDNVHIQNVNLIYDDGQDSHSVMKGFEQGNYVQAGIMGSWDPKEQEEYKKKYDGKITYPMPGIFTYNITFNYNRRTYNHTAHKTTAEKELAQKALRNVNFRKAFRAAFDRVTYLSQRTGNAELAAKMVRNNMTPGDFVTVNKQTFAESVASQLQDKEMIKGDYNDGNDAFFNPEMAMKYIEKAKADGIQFPVALDYLVMDDELSINQSASLKNTIEKNTGGQIKLNIVTEKNRDLFIAASYDFMDAAKADSDISDASGWGADYLDPKSYLNIYSPVNGDMIKYIGINSEVNDFHQESDKEAATVVRLEEYQKLLEEANAITDDLNKRYEAYAKAEAWLTDNALEIPVSTTPIMFRVSRLKPFSGEYSFAGPCGDKMKHRIVQKEAVTTEQYNKAKQDWLDKRKGN